MTSFTAYFDLHPTFSTPDATHILPFNTHRPASAANVPAAHYKPPNRKCSGQTCSLTSTIFRRSTSDWDLALYVHLTKNLSLPEATSREQTGRCRLFGPPGSAKGTLTSRAV